jgi:hypothetical protein
MAEDLPFKQYPVHLIIYELPLPFLLYEMFLKATRKMVDRIQAQ